MTFIHPSNSVILMLKMQKLRCWAGNINVPRSRGENEALMGLKPRSAVSEIHAFQQYTLSLFHSNKNKAVL